MTVKRFQQKMQQLMKDRGWKKYRLAEEMGVSPSTLQYVFKRDRFPKFETIEKMCSAFDMTIPEFFLEDLVVGKKAGETQTLEIIIEFVKQMPDAQQRRVLNIVQALAKDTLIAAEAIEDAVKDNQPKTKKGKKK
ncbi:helix-turn-helix transcriptional regulator [Butyrivibrio sp.]|uniref:helix-turn-helix domain-containing protein n=1 Tax=Butyrivibrio sp. TaxID=28121 RepID=UPI0025B8D994|nr:helix-turn-helix transcriptional regulator [Butyrivibrio sp.]MBQ9304065.1 helix-turn-helix transcriptional regulator [Butyrivibrio sp.]